MDQGAKFENISGVIRRCEDLVYVLDDSAQKIPIDSEGIKTEVEDILLRMHFQDRTSQMLSHVLSDIKKLEEFVSAQRQRIDLNQDVETVDIDA